jgi:tetratricopeptide (TPR) repeat protein
VTKPLPRLRTALAAAVLVLAGITAYHNSLNGPLVFDDLPSIRDNPSIRHLGTALNPPPGMTVDARPVLNASLALNYAWGGLSVSGFHLVNCAIHILAGLVLFGIVRRTLERAPFGTGGLTPAGFALAVAAIWVVHPLQTESVSYVIQRAESLMGLWYLLTLYCFIRYSGVGAVERGLPRAPNEARPEVALHLPNAGGKARPPGALVWGVLSVGACLLGMATKEVMVSAPVLVLLYDRSFVAGTFTGAFRRRGRLYWGLAATWVVLALLAVSSPGRGGSTGFGSGVAWPSYVAIQFRSILRYLWLAAWPGRLVFDYGPESPQSTAGLLASAAIVLGLAAASAAAAWRKSPWGFLGVWFFAILGPTSLVPGALQMTAEHRMYLPLAAVSAAAVAGIAWGARRIHRRAAVPALAGLVAALIVATSSRNDVYRSELGLWADTVEKRPENPAARVNLGISEFVLGRYRRSEVQFAQAVRLEPGSATAHRDLAGARLRLGRTAEAKEDLAAAIRLDPKNPDAHNELASVLAAEGDWRGAADHFVAAARSWPDDAAARFRAAEALLRCGRPESAVPEYEAGLKLDPGNVNAHNDCGVALLRMGALEAARLQFRAALRLDPADADARRNLASLGQ